MASSRCCTAATCGSLTRPHNAHSAHQPPQETTQSYARRHYGLHNGEPVATDRSVTPPLLPEHQTPTPSQDVAARHGQDIVFGSQRMQVPAQRKYPLKHGLKKKLLQRRQPLPLLNLRTWNAHNLDSGSAGAEGSVVCDWRAAEPESLSTRSALPQPSYTPAHHTASPQHSMAKAGSSAIAHRTTDNDNIHTLRIVNRGTAVNVGTVVHTHPQRQPLLV
jgi:hypothetical protein